MYIKTRAAGRILAGSVLGKWLVALTLSMTLTHVCLPCIAADGDTPPGGTIAAAPHHRKLVLLLGGGGAKGLAHLGVLRSLERAGIKPDYICGTSIGALVGCFGATNLSTAKIEEILLAGKLDNAFFPRAAAVQGAAYMPGYVFGGLTGHKSAIGFFSGESISRFIKKSLPSDMVNIEQLPTTFLADCVDLKTGKKVTLDRGDIAEAVQASNAVPFMYRPVKSQGRILVDGGVVENIPPVPAGLNPVDIVVVGVRLHAFIPPKDDESLNTNRKYADRIISLLMSSVEQKSSNRVHIMIEPHVENIKQNAFDKDEMLKAIEAGEKAGDEALSAIKQALEKP